MAVCKAGLDQVHGSFEFIRGGRTYKMREAMEAIQGAFPGTATVVGTAVRISDLTVPYRFVDSYVMS